MYCTKRLHNFQFIFALTFKILIFEQVFNKFDVLTEKKHARSINFLPRIQFTNTFSAPASEPLIQKLARALQNLTKKTKYIKVVE